MKKILINGFYFLSGICFLMLAKIKNRVIGYSPKDFSTNEIKRCIEYDIAIVEDWLAHLKEYAPDRSIENSRILELGPGSDLGIGLYLLSKSAKKYMAVDIYELASKVSPHFYDAFFAYLKETYQANVSSLIEEFNKTKKGQANRLNYICNRGFNIVEALGDNPIDIIFSNAAFEHFENIRKTIEEISSVASPGALFIVSVDLQTHSRWIREKDPDNIYRYPNRLYKMLSTRSSPNRKRPYEYKAALEAFGWGNIIIKPERMLEKNKLDFIHDHLHKDFTDPVNQMDYLTIWICATKL
jgi:SAM-dependent methyltransferase